MKITISNLSKIYNNGTRALNDINMEIVSGMSGLLGPNGAGKTTLMRILVTHMKPTVGTVTVDEYDLQRNRAEIRSLIGYLPQEFRLFPQLTTGEFLDYSARLAGMRRSGVRHDEVDKMLESVGLYEVRDRLANKLSGGMKRRLGIAQALIGNPKIVIVDEPTTGLDPEERLRFRNLLAEMSREDIIIILSTHIVGDISSACHTMAMLNKGDLAYAGSPGWLLEKARGHVWQISADDAELEHIKTIYPVISTIPSERGWDVQVVAQELDGYHGEPIEPNLEHAYVYFLEHELHEPWNVE